MKKFITIAAGTLAALGFSAPVFAQAGSVQGGMSAEEHQQMMSAGGATGRGQRMSDPDMHRRMMAMMERCEEMMAKKDKRASATGLQSTRKTSAESKWAWRPDPRQAPGPRAPLRPPVRVWVPADKSSTN